MVGRLGSVSGQYTMQVTSTPRHRCPSGSTPAERYSDGWVALNYERELIVDLRCPDRVLDLKFKVLGAIDGPNADPVRTLAGAVTRPSKEWYSTSRRRSRCTAKVVSIPEA